MFAKIQTCGIQGVVAYLVSVEVFVSPGLPSFDIVGLPSAPVRESKERVRASIKINGYEFLSRRITINLAPACMRKEGSMYDLPIAVALLVATEQIKSKFLHECVIVGELCLDGSVNGIAGVLPIVLCAKENGMKVAIVPKANEMEAGLVQGIKVIGVQSLKEVVAYLNGKIHIDEVKININDVLKNSGRYDIDFCDVKGQKSVKRALEVAVAGGHNVIMSGSAGSGKTMLAKRIVTILPDMTFDECLEVTKIHSVVGKLKSDGYIKTIRPFRMPHSSISQSALIGGGLNAMPGEISLAHYGVLFLDEISEFPKNMLEELRQPLEDKSITISRSNYTVTYPCQIMLVGAMNLCPCGNLGSLNKGCKCSDFQLQRYSEKISGALIDRFDIQVEVAPVRNSDLVNDCNTECSNDIRNRVNEARKMQVRRFKGSDIFSNAEIRDSEIGKYCVLEKNADLVLKSAFDRLGLSARGYSRVLKVARTIADLNFSDLVMERHVLEAIGYRALDRK